jgi:hypothetical protein
MVHTNPEFEISNLILDFEFDQHLGSHKHVINIIMWFRDMGCYSHPLNRRLRGYYRDLVARVPWAIGFGQKIWI